MLTVKLGSEEYGTFFILFFASSKNIFVESIFESPNNSFNAQVEIIIVNCINFRMFSGNLLDKK